jgi:hypothetical protein
MSIPMILAPLFVQVALTFALLFWTGRARVGLVQRGEVHPRDIALREANWATPTRTSSNCRCCSTCLPSW